ncbi:MAG: sulfurtransferase TusA family protein [Candidatus Caldarchaeum sp.]|nr:sulfurtransferase TusA family protein [Candidatus Caldarchaeum sp.]MCS7137893.1 sulfurtransferase TusA family protein [Candidatus Caldarchaeum sp.]MDW7978224.1 sulfurtransferase TusA family protein [Candidatus Caldarchaeum sp.]MDW8359229.1 sulfurtransferase TusA family protein [Candidatus Caldarchaeum sp.]
MSQASRRVIDSRGSFCPGPLTDLFKAYKEAKNGDILELWATDPAAKSDVQAWARKTGNVVEEVVEEQGYVKIVVKVTAKSG